MKLKFHKNNKKIFSIILPLVLILGIFFIGNYAHADIGWVTKIITGFLSIFISALGVILTLVIRALVYIASYQHFIDAQAIKFGWHMVRDICNMFFVVILIIIAFGTILHLENYNYKKWLPKLILMAILINFSKTICGLLIDASQIVMLTFVNAFKDIGGANLTDMLGLSKIVTMADGDSSFTTVVGAYILGLLYLLVALVVLVTMMAVLVMRLVMIWIYVVLSPLAYLLAAFPGGQKYASQWWNEFIKNLIVGPVLAFFIWLSLASLSGVNNMANQSQGTNGAVQNDINAIQHAGISRSGEEPGSNDIGTQASTPSALIGFMVGIGMLLGGLKISQEVGGATGSIAGKGMAKLNKGAIDIGGVSKKALKLPGRGFVAGGRALAGTKKGKNLLGKIGGSSNVVLRYSGVRSLATKGLSSVNSHQKNVEKKAQEKISNISDTRILSRFVNEKAFTPEGKAMKRKAKNKMPSAIKDNKERENHLASMSSDDLKNVSGAEWHSLGNKGTEMTGNARAHLEKNSQARGAYNMGLDKLNNESYNQAVANGDQDFKHIKKIIGTDRKGNKMDPRKDADAFGSHLSPQNQPISEDVQNRLGRNDKYRNAYWKEEASEANGATRVKTESADSPRGNGHLSVNDFARGKSETVAVDFDKLGVKAIDKGKDADYSHIRGFNTNDPSVIKDISSKMTNSIDQELKTFDNKKDLSPGDQKRKNNLETAKEKFSNPDNLKNINLLNSSAASYKISDVKKSKVHEEVHGLGYANEDETRYITQKIIDNHQYDTLKSKTETDKILAARPKKKTVAEVIGSENNSVAESRNSKIDLGGLDQAINNFSKKIDNLGKSFSAGGLSSSSSLDQANSSVLFKGLKKALIKGNKTVGKQIASLGGAKAKTPLEVDVISQKVSDQINKEKI